MIDNLFIVESPLQALIAVELSLQFEGQENGIIFRLSGKNRERNDEQICSVVELGDWSFKEKVKFAETAGLTWHINARKYIVELKKRFRGSVRNLFFGEFRSQWMHFARLAIAPEKFVLIDDGAATLIAKSRYIDQGIFYPRELFASKSIIKQVVINAIYFGVFEAEQAKRSVAFASAFLVDESEFEVDFASLRRKLARQPNTELEVLPKAYFFGSKYSEAGILSRSYELEFISNVLKYYKGKGLALVYCAHRDESEIKLDAIRSLKGVDVIRPSLPAELFLIERDADIIEIGAAYSSVINNLSLIFPDKAIRSFRLEPEAVDQKNRQAVNRIYDYYAQLGIPVESFSSTSQNYKYEFLV